MKKITITILLALFISQISIAQHHSVNWEKFKYSGPGLDQIGWLATKQAKDIEYSKEDGFPFWSIGCETLDRDYADFSKYKDYVGELGIKRARIQSGWAKTEKEKGVYNFEWLDEIVFGLLEQGVRPWISISYGNPIYGAEFRLGARIFTDEETMSAWLRYTEALVNRYKDVVHEWEVWNEPNLRNGGYTEYANLLMNTAEVIKRIQPDAEVIGLATSGIQIEFSEEVLKILKANNKLDLVDYLTYHPYTNNPDDSYPQVENLRSMVHSYSPDIKLFQGENGAPAILEFAHALNYYPWTEVSQTKWRMRRMAGDRVRNIPTSIFTMIDLQYPNMLQSFGLLRANLLYEVIYKRPSFYAVQHMASFFDGTAEAIGELGYQSNAYRKMTVAGFKKEGRPVSLIWYNDRVPSDEIKWDLVNLTIEDVTFQDPVYVEMISGKVYEIAPADWEATGEDTRFKNFPVWDSVVMIAERSLVDLK